MNLSLIVVVSGVSFIMAVVCETGPWTVNTFYAVVDEATKYVSRIWSYCLIMDMS